jgi:two-component system response regulator
MKTQGTILLVEDSADDADLAVIAFQKLNFPYKIVIANDGAEASDYLFGTGKFAGRDKKDAPALVLLDLKIPKVDGFELLRRIRSDDGLQNTRVAILTSSTEDKDQEMAVELKADLYLKKPVDFSEFLTLVKTVEPLVVAQ